MPSWLKNQLTRAFRERDSRAVLMLNRVYFKYRKQSISSSDHSAITYDKS